MTDDQHHPAFPQPANPNISLWRYLDFEKFDWLLTYGRLFMPSAAHLGDPLEGTRPAGDSEWWQREIANAESQEKRHVLEHNHDLLSRFAYAFRAHYYVSCWHASEVENARMWNCYTRSPTAVAVQTKYSKLRNLLPNYVELGLVRYIDYRIDRLPSSNMMECVTHKNIGYSFENEIRAVVLHPPFEAIGGAHFQEHHFESETVNGFFLYAPTIDVTQLIERIVLHPKATHKIKNEVARICEIKGLPQPVQSGFQGVSACAL
jgi:hypothetical protein